MATDTKGVARSLILLAAVALTHYGYYLIPDAAGRRWAFYIARGIEATTMACMLLRPVPWGSTAARGLGAFAAMLAVLEETQTTVCGAAEWRRADISDDLCMAWLGGHTFAALAAVVVATLIVFRRGRT